MPATAGHAPAAQYDGLDDGAHLRRQPGQRLADVAVLHRQQHLVLRGRRDPGVPGHGGDAAAGPQAAHQPADRDPPQPRRDVAVAAEAPRFLPDGVALVQRAEGAHVAFGDGQKQRLVARAAVHVLTVASPGRKSFTPRREISTGPSAAA